jgi:hypothetical protein
LLDACRLAVESHDFEFRTAFSPLEHELAQMLCLGGTELSELLVALHDAGIQFDGGLPEAARPVIEGFVAARTGATDPLSEERDASWQPFFSFVDCGISPDELHRRYLGCRAWLENPLPPEPVANRPRRPGPDQRKVLAALLSDKNRAPVLRLAVQVDRDLAGASREWLEAWCLRGLAGLLGGVDGIVDVKLLGHGKEETFWPAAWHGLADFQLAWETESRLPERLAAYIATPAHRGLVIKSVGECLGGACQLAMSVDLPIPVAQAAAGWNRLIQSIGLGATMTKPETGVCFAVSHRDKGKKSLHSIELSPIDGAASRCRLIAGPRFHTDKAMASLLSGRHNPFIPLEITEIIRRI